MGVTPERHSDVFVGIASVAGREPMLQRAVDSLIGQVGGMGVYLNGYRRVPAFLRHPRISVVRSQDLGDVRDNGKFYFLGTTKLAFYATADDDIEYPSDYVDRLRSRLVELTGTVAVGVHGAVYPTPIRGLFAPRRLYHFIDPLSFVVPVHLLGTGTVMFDQRIWRLGYDEFGEPGMADVWFARSARCRDAELFVVNRNQRWLVPLERDEGSGAESPRLYSEAVADGSRQVELMSEAGISTGGFPRIVRQLLGQDGLAERFSLSHAIELDALRRDLGWLPLDESTGAWVADRLGGLRDGWSHTVPCPASTIASYSRAGVGLLTCDLDAQTVLGALEVLRLCVGLERGADARWRRLPSALRFDARGTKVPSIRAALLDHGIRRGAENARELWPHLADDYRSSRYLAKPPPAALELLLTAERAGVDTGFQDLPMLAAVARNNPEEAAIALGAYLEQHDWAITPNPRVWRGIFGPADGSKQIQLLLCMAALRSGSRDWAARRVREQMHRAPLDVDYTVLAALAEMAEAAPIAEKLRGWLPVLDRILAVLEIGSFSQFVVNGGFDSDHWIEALSRPSTQQIPDDRLRHDESRISVVMTVHNDAATVAAAARSVLVADGVEIELIIVDDASSDGTEQVLRSLASSDPRVRLIRNPHNLGTYMSRNRALACASGEFLTFADADDWSHPDRFRYQVARLKARPDLLGCTVSHVRVTPNGQPDLENNLAFLGHGPVSLMFRRFVVDQIGGFDHVRTRGDIEYMRRMRARFGDEVLEGFEVPLILATSTPSSNSKRFTAEDLRIYRQGFRRWHQKFAMSDALYVPLDGDERAPFIAPATLTGSG